MKKTTLILLVIVLAVVWVIGIALTDFSGEKPITARTLTNSWVMGHYAANPDEEIVIVDTIAKLWYVPKVWYWVPGDFTQMEFESTQDTTGTYMSLMFKGNLTGTFKPGDKVTIRFTLNQFISGIPQTINPLPASSIQKYSEFSYLPNLTPLIIPAVVTVVVALIILKDRVRKVQYVNGTIPTTTKGPPLPPGMVQCRFCRAAIPSGSVYCEKCGKKI